MKMTLNVKVIEYRPNGDDAIDFKLRDIEADVIYELHYCHRTDILCCAHEGIKCYFGELYLDGKDLGLAHLLETYGECILSFNTNK